MAAAASRGEVSGLAPLADWLGGVPCTERWAGDVRELWLHGDAAVPIVWCRYERHRIVVRGEDRVVVGIECVPRPLSAGVARPTADLDVCWNQPRAYDHDLGFWCRKWTTTKDGEDSANETAAWLLHVGASLQVPDALSTAWLAAVDANS